MVTGLLCNVAAFFASNVGNIPSCLAPKALPLRKGAVTIKKLPAKELMFQR